MSKVYKRKGEEPAYECGECGTVWKESWVDTEGVCPFCHTRFEKTKEKHLTELKKGSSPEWKRFWLEQEIAEIDTKLSKLEATPVMERVRIGNTEPVEEKAHELRMRHIADVQKISNLRAKRLTAIIKLTKFKTKAKEVVGMPYLLIQNREDKLISRNTIRPQLDWEIVERMFPRDKWSVKIT